MLVYDYVELKEELFEHIINGSLPYKVENKESTIKSFYKCLGQTVIEMYEKDTNNYQYFINSAYPV